MKLQLFVAFRHLAIRHTQDPQDEIPRMKEPTGLLYYRDRYSAFVYLVILGYRSTKYVNSSLLTHAPCTVHVVGIWVSKTALFIQRNL